MTTTALTLAARYNNDGIRWLDADGIRLGDAIDEIGATRIRTTERGSDIWRFADGSAIATTEAGWDVVVEYPDGTWASKDAPYGNGYVFEVA